MLCSLIVVTYRHNYYHRINLSHIFHSKIKYRIILWVILQTVEKYLLYLEKKIRFMFDTNIQFQVEEYETEKFTCSMPLYV